jgi:hypothetical protein
VVERHVPDDDARVRSADGILRLHEQSLENRQGNGADEPRLLRDKVLCCDSPPRLLLGKTLGELPDVNGKS